MEIIEKYFLEFGEIQRPMAASVQSLQYCVNLIRKEKPSQILDLGSGLSSVVFHSQFDNVQTLDDNPYWASRTKEFIAANIFKDLDIGPITAINDQSFPFIYYDYGNIETRIYYFKKALELSSGYLFVDDMHINYYREYVQTKSRGHILKFVPESLDEYGRYGALIVKQ
ncbi:MULTISPECIES: hypothetical protein [Niastella]|uniref:Methyltransferase n=1 Tax=Niastella soli TaxID=2821487 RepID=A0ABS3Z5W3_9BACT|nr:hypothetical protein [Niastella soli]MBO9205532.1 hypothetical protein [Niastella soli]